MTAQRGFDRLVNLSDAVVAIAATLLVLPLVDAASEVTGTDALGILSENGDELLAFLLSFAVICRFWLIHHAMYARVTGFTLPLIWANFLWLASIAFLPFPTELVSFSGNGNPGTAALYVGTMLVTSIASTLQQAIIASHPEIQAEDVRGTVRIRPSVVATITMAAVLLIVLLLPAVGLYALLLLLPSGFVEARVAQRGQGPAAP